MLRWRLYLALVTVVIASCSDDAGESSTTSAVPLTVPAATASPTTPPAPTSSTGQTTVASSTTLVASTTTESATPGQTVIWPAPDVVFTTPQQAAEDFVAKVLRVPPVLGELRLGDARSGEIDVLSPGEGASATPVVRSTLLVRLVGPAGGWVVLAAANDNASVTSPTSAAEVPAAPLTVTGRGRGFEANIVVTAFVAGEADHVLDQQITMGGAAETPEPFTVTLDLSGAAPGDTVVLLVRGGAGLETDPGEFGAIPVTITR